MTDPLVSVVLPVHDGQAHLDGAVRSILAQGLADFELVICDDGSEDGTAEIIASFASKDPRIRVFRRATKSGVAAAANWAVSHARSPLVAMAHADDLCFPDRLERQFRIMQEREECVLVGSVPATIDWHGNIAHAANLRRLAFPGVSSPIAHSSIMFRRVAFDQVGGYRTDANYWEDLDLYWRLARRGTILVSPRPLIIYRYSRTSIRQRECSLDVERALEAQYRCAQVVKSGGVPDPGLRPGESQRIHPRIFVARSWSGVWAGERPALLRRLFTRGRLRLDRASVESVVFMVWATVSPRSLRAVLRQMTRAINRLARMRLGDADFVEWKPLSEPVPASEPNRQPLGQQA